MKLRVGIVLMPNFTMTAFSGFVDALRLAADEGDHSRQIHCGWEVLGAREGDAVLSSCGVRVQTTAQIGSAEDYDTLVVVGGVLHGGQRLPAGAARLFKQAAAEGKRLIGLCTGSFVLTRLGLMQGHLACVSWFHRDEFEAEFPAQPLTSSQMFVVDRDRWTCAGGTSVVHLAAYLIERTLGRARATKALRILIEQQPLPSRTLQPEAVISVNARDPLVHKTMLLIEQQLHRQVSIESACGSAGVSARQLQRRFMADIGMTPAQYRQKLRGERARWLARHSAMTLAEIAAECGFASSVHLSRLITRELGGSLRQVRASLAMAAQQTP